MKKETIELLAPARDIECGIAAIDHGADAVYIGGPAFSARAAAGNSLDDISRLIEYAHGYFSRVYIALNTLLKDDEIAPAVEMMHTFHQMRADAVIIQDMGLLECDLPPIALHASTQVDIQTVEKVKFLEGVGFQQVVLARELSLEQITEIAAKSSVALECFVHGALCVSYSGRCHISEVMTGRSGNRGECAQFCRHSFSLRDSRGKSIEHNRNLLSLKDLCQLDNIESLMNAGVRSFKIEGRLKGSGYVKNITALYRKKLDSVLENYPKLEKSSSGTLRINFKPDERKTFHRGRTEYFLHRKRNRPGSIDSPKSQGEPLGKVLREGKKHIVISSKKKLNNGDGLCYFNKRRELIGFRLNRADGNVLHPARMVYPGVGTMIYRNHDQEFHTLLAASKNCRKIDVTLKVEETETGLAITIEDEDGIVSRRETLAEKIVAQKPELTVAAIQRQVAQSGDTIFHVCHVRVEVSPARYYPAATLKELRRRGLEGHLYTRCSLMIAEPVHLSRNSLKWPGPPVSRWANVLNTRALDFFNNHGAHLTDTGDSPDLMICKYCIKAQLEFCPKEAGTDGGRYLEPLFLRDNVAEYRLHFDCHNCEMIVRKK